MVERKALNLVVMGSSPMAGVSYNVNCYIELYINEFMEL